jgi:hypothetical protein
MQVSGGTGLLITIYCRVRVSGILLNMYMRKPNLAADKVTKHVLEYLLTRFNLQPGDINNIRMIITRSLNKNTKSQIVLPELKNKKNKGPID